MMPIGQCLKNSKGINTAEVLYIFRFLQLGFINLKMVNSILQDLIHYNFSPKHHSFADKSVNRTLTF